MIILLVFLVQISVAAVVQPAGTCSDSQSCAANQCCRDGTGHVLSYQQHFGGSHSSGTCTHTLAQKGEMCDSHCKCGPGYECYRPMSGVCCPPMTCMNATYVQQQRKYWANCFSNPKCAIPP